MCTHPDSDLRLLLREYIRVVNVTAVVLRVAAGRLKNSCPKYQEDGYTCAKLWTNKSIHSWRRYAQQTIFYIFVPSDLELWPLDFIFALVVTLVQRHVSTKLEVSADFLFRENRRNETDGQTDRVQHIMLPLMGGPHNNFPRMLGRGNARDCELVYYRLNTLPERSIITTLK